ncbi:MAG: hypothetical protein A2Z91_03625 [Deltaproteobacteria bacterium GWA2_38_16]|nr:MAG: hypothetical protein A2Z91_03625 [Deltaproteobacteria bacterium GWA2_38_16]OGQ02317.1 MAG: hypothetical protein A3D19_05800 [Deltaproteobacteria bacterium RIFCSPHIGHO2_02_FULL_38_15]OGQ30438.1 MAG: hypothetical protein A3A72_02545 [Deltaproteobacteria bacterium RIFCSPLOWO2_01_FULL_38_9]HBQ22085.1 hypothetical protein [Deltaproteobacteria bacterium]
MIWQKGIVVFVGIVLFSLFHYSPVQAADFLKYFTFSEANVLKIWKEKLYKGKVDYKIIKGPGQDFIQATAKNAASGIYYEFPDKEFYNPTSKPFISWKWKVNRFPKKEDEKVEDFAARIYVIFPAKVFIFSKCIEYVWDDKLAQGTRTKSSLSSRIQIFVLQNGKKEGWIQEERNVVEDYKQAFGEDEVDDKIGAIAFMSDSDDSETEGQSLFDEIKIGYSHSILKK